MKPFFQDNLETIYCGDCRNMGEIADGSVQCVPTSPPYWGLRKYKGNQELIWGGDKDCEHRFDIDTAPRRNRGTLDIVDPDSKQATNFSSAYDATPMKMCSLCGAWKGAFGLEPTPELYVQHTIEILREIRRVLRKDGVVFWNIGDSYMGSGQDSGKVAGQKRCGDTGIDIRSVDIIGVGEPVTRLKHKILKPKDLCLIPFHIAIAAQEDGWWIRSVIIWNKPNPMPESVTDRPTNSYEFILMLTKSKNYYWDADAVREPTDLYTEKFRSSSYYVNQGSAPSDNHRGDTGARHTLSGRNLRDVWTFPTQPYPEAHFAVFPEKLPELCIKAATSEKGCCPKCGSPWARVTETPEPPEELYTKSTRPNNGLIHTGIRRDGTFRGSGQKVQDWREENPTQTLGWRPTCHCERSEAIPCIVLDPFMGTGTTLWVAKKLGRHAIGYDISEAYCQLAVERNRQAVISF